MNAPNNNRPFVHMPTQAAGVPLTPEEINHHINECQETIQRLERLLSQGRVDRNRARNLPQPATRADRPQEVPPPQEHLNLLERELVEARNRLAMWNEQLQRFQRR